MYSGLSRVFASLRGDGDNTVVIVKREPFLTFWLLNSLSGERQIASEEWLRRTCEESP